METLQGRIPAKDLSNAISNKPRCVDKTKDEEGGRIVGQEEERLEEGAVKPENRAWSREPSGQNDPRTRHAGAVITAVIARVVNRTSARDLLRRMRELARVLARASKQRCCTPPRISRKGIALSKKIGSQVSN